MQMSQQGTFPHITPLAAANSVSRHTCAVLANVPRVRVVRHAVLCDTQLQRATALVYNKLVPLLRGALFKVSSSRHHCSARRLLHSARPRPNCNAQFVGAISAARWVQPVTLDRPRRGAFSCS